MVTTKRCKILVVDKKDKYSLIFKGFRKNKFAINSIPSVLNSTEMELFETSIFFVVLYEPKDYIQVIKLAPISKSIIIGTVNKRLFTSFRTIKDYPLVDLSVNFNFISNLQEALTMFY
jgi:hypothetical protein